MDVLVAFVLPNDFAFLGVSNVNSRRSIDAVNGSLTSNMDSENC